MNKIQFLCLKGYERRTIIMIKAAIVGATGYAGNELVRILMQHPEVLSPLYHLHCIDLQSYLYLGNKKSSVS